MSESSYSVGMGQVVSSSKSIVQLEAERVKINNKKREELDRKVCEQLGIDYSLGYVTYDQAKQAREQEGSDTSDIEEIKKKVDEKYSDELNQIDEKIKTFEYSNSIGRIIGGAWYEDSDIRRIISSDKGNEGLYSEITGANDRNEFDAYFQLAGLLKKPIAVFFQNIPLRTIRTTQGIHWELLYFIDGKTLLHFDPFSKSSHNPGVANIVKQFDGKKLYTSVTKVQNDGSSCGPISTEMAMHLMQQNSQTLKTQLNKKDTKKTGLVDIREILPDTLKNFNGKKAKQLRKKHEEIAQPELPELPLLDIASTYKSVAGQKAHHPIKGDPHKVVRIDGILNYEGVGTAFEELLRKHNPEKLDAVKHATDSSSMDPDSGISSGSGSETSSQSSDSGIANEDETNKDSLATDAVKPVKQNITLLRSIPKDDITTTEQKLYQQDKSPQKKSKFSEFFKDDSSKFIITSAACFILSAGVYSAAFLLKFAENSAKIKASLVAIGSVSLLAFCISLTFACAAKQPSTELNNSSIQSDKVKMESDLVK